MKIPATTQVLYRERVTPKWTSFLPLALVLPTFWLMLAPMNAILGQIIGVSITATVALLMIQNSPEIIVSNTHLKVGKASIEIEFIGVVEDVPYSSRFGQRLPHLDPRAFLVLQNSRKGLIKLKIVDPKDPTPYWIISTKNPKLLIQSLELAKKTN